MCYFNKEFEQFHSPLFQLGPIQTPQAITPKSSILPIVLQTFIINEALNSTPNSAYPSSFPDSQKMNMTIF